MAYQLPGQFKIGSSLILPFKVTTPLGADVDISLWTLRSQVRTETDLLVTEVTLTLPNGGLDGAGQIQVAPAQTALWPTTVLFMDITLLDHLGDVYITEDILIDVRKVRTHD